MILISMARIVSPCVLMGCISILLLELVLERKVVLVVPLLITKLEHVHQLALMEHLLMPLRRHALPNATVLTMLTQ